MSTTATELDFGPGVGAAVGVDEAKRDFHAGNYGLAAAGLGLTAIGELPGGDFVAKAGKELLMDQASRMGRAKDMGFHTGLPLYHGSDATFPEFDLGQAGTTSGAAPSRLGVWTATDPETADEFAVQAAKARGGSQQVYPLLHRASKPGVVDLDGSETGLEVAGAILDAFDSGHDAVMFRNYTTPGGKTGKNIIVIRDPAQVRSVFARFDPSRMNSRDLLASLIGVGAAGVVSEEMAAAQGAGD